MRAWTCLLLLLCVFATTAMAQEFDPYLHQKAADYTAYLRQWHSTGLGGVSDVLFTDENRTELLRTWGSGDSGDWTGTYLVTQAIRYQITGEQEARDEVLRIAHYMHILKDITGDPGYLARYAAPDEAPWNVESIDSDARYAGTGEYEGNFWLGKNVRDKYITWFWGLTWAYDAVDDATMKDTIREDFRDVILTLESNGWKIIDPWGGIYSAAEIMPDIRLSILVQAAHVIDEAYFWDLLDAEYEKNKTYLWVSSIAFFNRYSDYYAFINNYSNVPNLHRLWPDRERLEHLFNIWKVNVRTWSNDGHNPFFDSVYYAACLRLGGCDAGELEAMAVDIRHSLEVMWEAPNYQRAVTCSEMPLDPFSVWASDLLEQYPWIEELTGFDINPQTLDAHEVDDRCWESVMWERSPYHVSCDIPDDPAHTAHGVDYLIGYWLAVYYGILPEGGPYGDDELIEPGDDDDDNDNDDTSPTDDDDNNDNNDNNDENDDNDDNNDDNDDDDDTSPAVDDDDNNDDETGCGC